MSFGYSNMELTIYIYAGLTIFLLIILIIMGIVLFIDKNK